MRGAPSLHLLMMFLTHHLQQRHLKQEAVERVTNYKEMSKSQMDNAYDKMRADDPNKAAIEGMKMHKAFFNK